jgi:hypothetical protein
LEDFEMQTGMGFSFIVLHTIMLQAVWERRTLVFASAAFPGATWRWCGTGSQDFGCYFEPWSSCEKYIASKKFSSPDSVPAWEPTEQNLGEQVVVLRQAHDRMRRAMWKIYRTWDNMTHAPLAGRAWWWSVTYETLLRIRPEVQQQATTLMAQHGVQPGDPLIVAVVRHGGKHHEEKEISVAAYEEPISKFTQTNCLKTTNVFLTTETLSVVKEFSKMCSRRKWNCVSLATLTRIGRSMRLAAPVTN